MSRNLKQKRAGRETRLDREHGLMLQLVKLDAEYQEVLTALVNRLEPESRALLACDSRFNAMLRRVDETRFSENQFGLHFADLGRPPVGMALAV
jgi:nitrous oxidase accessory protein NosD